MIVNYSEVQILLAEDNASDSELTMRALRKGDLVKNLLHVKDGAEALDFLFAQGEYESGAGVHKPKLVLLDLKMPKVTGLEVLKQIKSDDRTKSIPVVMLTSSHEDRDIIECYEYGVNSYIVKPVEFDKFMTAVSELGLYWMFLNQSKAS